MKELLFDRFETPVGEVLLVATPDRPELYALDYADYEARMRKLLGQRFPEFSLKESRNPYNFRTLLEAYFAGDFKAVENIAVQPGGTEFQQRVWQMLRTIPTGTTASYGQLATKLGKPGAARAVGLANSLNPVAIVVPCHRVIGANQSLTGYAGGLERKRWLLDHERAHATLILATTMQTGSRQLSLFNG